MNIPDFLPDDARPLLVSQPPGTTAILVERVGKRRRSTPKQFANPHAALDWCERERVTFLHLPAPDNSGN
jgi:hypothetical protein